MMPINIKYFVYIFLFVPFFAFGLMPEGVTNLGHVLNTMVNGAIYTPGTDSAPCQNSEAHAEETNPDNLRVDVKYMNSKECNINEAQGDDKDTVQKFSGELEAKNGLGNVVFVSVDGRDTRQIVLTTLHTLEDQNHHLPAVGPNGQVDPKLAKIKSAACGETYAVKTLSPCPPSLAAYQKGEHLDCTVAVLDRPACDKVESIPLKVITKDDLSSLRKPDGLTLAATYIHDLVCNKPKGIKSFVNLPHMPAGADPNDVRTYTSTGPLTAADLNVGMLAYRLDSIHMASGAGLISHFGKPDQALIGINVVPAADGYDANEGIFIDDSIMEKVRHCTDKIIGPGDGNV